MLGIIVFPNIENGFYGNINAIFYGKLSAVMNATLTLDRAGRVVLPKAIREELQIGPGDSLELEASAEAIVLRPARGSGKMLKERGVWVFHAGTGTHVTAEAVKKTVNRVRRERDRKALGQYP